jgi:hypothetical protein
MGLHTLFIGQRERKRERERERERDREGGRKRGRERERERCPELFLFLKGMTGALAPFSYLVLYSNIINQYNNNKVCQVDWVRPKLLV